MKKFKFYYKKLPYLRTIRDRLKDSRELITDLWRVWTCVRKEHVLIREGEHGYEEAPGVGIIESSLDMERRAVLKEAERTFVASDSFVKSKLP